MIMALELQRIADAFQPRVKAELKDIGAAFLRLGRWLSDRLDEARPVEQRSRSFPIFSFRNDALTLWIEPSQHGSLADLHPDPGLGAAFASGGRRFLRGLGRTTEAVDEALLLPRLLDSVNRVLGRIADSVVRFTAPSLDRSLFNPEGRTVFDLFGQVALLGGTVLGGLRTFQRIRDDVAEARDRLRRAFPDSGSSSSTGTGGGNAMGAELPDALEEVSRWLLGGALFLMAAPGYLEHLIGAGGLRLRTQVLGALSGIERSIFQLRTDVMTSVRQHLPVLLVQGLSFLLTAEDLVMSNLRLYSRFAVLYGDEVLGQSVSFLDQTTAYINDWIDTVRLVDRVASAIWDTDLLPVILIYLGLPGAVPIEMLLHQAGLVTFTLGDLIDAQRATARAALTVFLGLVEGALAVGSGVEAAGRRAQDLDPRNLIPRIWHGRPIFPSHPNTLAAVRGRVTALRQVVGIALRPMIPLPPEVARPSWPRTFPNLADTLFPGGGAELQAFFAQAGLAVRGVVGSIFRTGQDTLLHLSATATGLSADARTLGSAAQVAQQDAFAARMARLVFGPQITELQRRAAGPADPLALAFEQHVRSAGFDLAGGVLWGFVVEMLEAWDRRAEEGGGASQRITPTSPHILARHARVGRAQMQALTLRAPGHSMDRALARRIADEFGRQVSAAYDAAQVELARLREETRP